MPKQIVQLLLALIALTSAASWASQVELTPQQEQRAIVLYGQLKCPVCKSQSVAASTSFLSEEIKRQIRELLAAGYSDQQIKDYFVARYGEWILLEPKITGQGFWVWIVPGIFLTLALIWLGWQLHRWSSASPSVTTKNPQMDNVDSNQPSQLSLEQRQKIQALLEG